jgi:hypoxanthine phosphoribosyltransferase
MRRAAPPSRDGLIPLYSTRQIRARVRALARRIRADYAGRDLVIVGVLKGAFVFMADLVRALGLPAALDFVGLSSYGAATETSGRVAITRPLQVAIAGKDVLVVEDILDTGLSMKVLLDDLAARGPRSVRVCALLDKRARRTEAIPADYVGFALPDGFVVGYGIDYAERHRELPAIYRLDRGADPGAPPTRPGRAAGGPASRSTRSPDRARRPAGATPRRPRRPAPPRSGGPPRTMRSARPRRRDRRG